MDFEAEGVTRFQVKTSFVQPEKLLVAALGEAGWCWDIRLGLGCRSALGGSGFVGRDFLSLWEMGQAFPCPGLCLMGCLEGVPDVFGKDVEREAGVPPGSSSLPSHRNWHLWCLSSQVGPKSHQ